MGAAARRRRRRFQALLASGRVGIVVPTLLVAPIIPNDELQNEHEQYDNDPPPYEE